MSEPADEAGSRAPAEAAESSKLGGLPATLEQTVERLAADPELVAEPRKLGRALTAVFTMHFRRGPLPHPQELAEFERVLPGAAERIFAASEKQAAHRMQLEQQTITAQNRQSAHGQLYGFIIAMVCLILSFAAIMTGHEVAGTIVGTVDLVALVTVFVLGKREQRENLRTKGRTIPASTQAE